MNLTLIGMAGAGKSHIGERAAKAMSMEYVDLDVQIEILKGHPLAEVLAELGDDTFVAFESEVAISATKSKDNLLISTGGSIVYAPEAMEHLRGISTVLYLDVSFEVIEKRIGNNAERISRIVHLRDKSMRQLYEERTVLYEKYAHQTLHLEHLSVEEAVALVTDVVKRVRATIPDNEPRF